MLNHASIKEFTKKIEPFLNEKMTKEEVLNLIKGLLMLSNKQTVELLDKQVSRCIEYHKTELNMFQKAYGYRLMPRNSKLITAMQEQLGICQSAAYKTCNICRSVTPYIKLTKNDY